jgi:tripartite-type tricarboxylate transporter receptor subunit TctC
VFVPKGASDAVVEKLNAAFNKSLASPALTKRLAELSIQPVGGPPSLAGRLLEEDVELWGPILRKKADANR